ncbi:TPA: hypothetical protein N2D99_002456 [Clostridium botulinum]|nr:hypothetical protein [Clostridium botulinum]
MFELKIDKELIEKCIDGISINEGDKLKIQCLNSSERTVEKEEVLTIKSIEHYNADLFILTFEENMGNYTFSLNQLIRCKIN